MNYNDLNNFSVEVEENVTIPLELIEDTLELLLNPKRIISDSNEIVLDWNKRTDIFQRLFDVMKKSSNAALVK